MKLLKQIFRSQAGQAPHDNSNNDDKYMSSGIIQLIVLHELLCSQWDFIILTCNL